MLSRSMTTPPSGVPTRKPPPPHGRLTWGGRNWHRQPRGQSLRGVRRLLGPVRPELQQVPSCPLSRCCLHHHHYRQQTPASRFSHPALCHRPGRGRRSWSISGALSPPPPQPQLAAFSSTKPAWIATSCGALAVTAGTNAVGSLTTAPSTPSRPRMPTRY